MWKITKGTEADFFNCPSWVKVVFKSTSNSEGFRGYVSEWEVGSDMTYGSKTSGPEDQVPTDKLYGYHNCGEVIARRVEVEAVCDINRGWLVNGKFTEDDRYADWATKNGYEVIAIKGGKQDILDLILAASVNVPPRVERKVFRALSEEVGEVGEALMALNTGYSPDEAIEGEIADVILCAVDLLFVHYQKQSFRENEEIADQVKSQLEDAVKRKLDKWVAKANGEENA